MTRPRVGFAGAGFIAGVHAGVLAADGRVSVAAVYDPDPRAAALFALKNGAAAVPSLDDLLGAVNVLYVCSPNALHADTAVRALDAGLHVFSEKPMATSGSDARSVMEAARRGPGVYQTGFNRRFAGVYRLLKQRIEAGALVPLSAQIKMNRGELRHPAWTGDAAISGGFLYETPVHMLDLVRHLLGEPVDIIGRARSVAYDQLDDFSFLLTWASGMTATLTTNAHATWLPPFERIELYGDHATAVTHEMDRITFSEGVGRESVTHDFGQQPFEERWGYIEEGRLFIDAVLGAGAPAVSAEDTYGTTMLIERCYAAVSQKAASG